MKIAFHTPQLDIRGSCNALYDYAHYNETMLKGKSIVILPRDKFNEPEALSKFILRFTIKTYASLRQMDEILMEEKCDALYLIKYGKNDGIYSRKIPNFVHCVFDLSEPHGEMYVAVSEQLAKKYNSPYYLPHIISLKQDISEDLRQEYKIPTGAIVIGRYGGSDTFDLPFVRRVISCTVREKDNIYFLLGNVICFDNHPNIIYVKKFSDLHFKKKFINTCDAYLEAGTLGHSFGIAQGEFSVFHKPLIIYGGQVWNDAHRNIVGEDAIYYWTEEELYNTLFNFEKHRAKNCYKQFSPENIMKQFHDYMLKLIG